MAEKKRVKKRALCSVVALALGLSLTIATEPVYAADISLSKGVHPPAPNTYYIGDTIHYAMVLRNRHGTEQLRIDLVEDFLPNGTVLTLDSTTDPAYPDFPYLLDPGQTQEYTLDWVVDADYVPPSGVVVNRLRVVGMQMSTLPDAFDVAVAKSSLIIRPDTEFTITASTDLVDAGGVVDLTVTGRNIGDVSLTNVSVTLNDGTDDIAVLTAPPDSGDLDDDGVLDPGEKWVWAIAGVTVEASTTFTVTMSGEDPLGNAVTYPEYTGARASVTVNMTGPGIKLRKLVNGDDAGSPTGPVVEVGSTVTFDFVVTNTGQVDLAPVVVTDDVLGSIGIVESLPPGASQTLSVTAAASAGQHSNLGTATGTPPSGPDVSTTAVAHYYGSDSAPPPANSEPRSVSRPALLAILISIGVAVAVGTIIFARHHRVGS